MHFASDNAGPVHPQVLEALVRANEGYARGYGADAITEAVTDRIRDILGAPQAAVHLVATGTAANALLLATLARPWDTVFCTAMAHVQEDECNAPEFFSGGAKLTLVADRDARMVPGALREALAKEQSRGVHGPQRGPVTITQATEKGTVYSPAQVADLSAVARDFGVKLHMDGARFANAVAALGVAPADITHRAGVDALSFGGTKNGLMGVEAAVLFDAQASWEFELRRKRGAHLFSKHRYLAAQMLAALTDDLWLTMAGAANRACARLTAGLRTAGAGIVWEPQANLVFARLPRRVHQRAMAAGASYYLWEGDLEGSDPEEPLMARFVCDWSIGDPEIDRFLELIGA